MYPRCLRLHVFNLLSVIWFSNERTKEYQLLLSTNSSQYHERSPTDSFKGNSPNCWMEKGSCLVSSYGMEGLVWGTGRCLNTLSEQHCQLAELYKRLSLSKKNEMELIADCHELTAENLMTTPGFCSMISLIGSLERL